MTRRISVSVFRSRVTSPRKTCGFEDVRPTHFGNFKCSRCGRLLGTDWAKLVQAMNGLSVPALKERK